MTRASHTPRAKGVNNADQDAYFCGDRMKVLRSTITWIVMLLPMKSFATVDYLSVNKMTREYFWGDEDHSPGWIGWTSVPERQLKTAEDDLIKLGYTETFYPYKIESYLTGIVLISVLGLFIIRSRRKAG